MCRALYEYAVPGLLMTADVFKSHFARPITDGADRDATPEQQVACMHAAAAAALAISVAAADGDGDHNDFWW